jgi:hypothetical protein
LPTEKERLKAAIAEKQAQLFGATKAASSWNSTRYKTKGYVQMSKSYVKSLQKDIKDLQQALAEIEKNK